MTITYQLLNSISEIDAIYDNWQTLYESLQGKTPMCHPGWSKSYFSHLTSLNPLIGTAYDGQELICVLSLERVHETYARTPTHGHTIGVELLLNSANENTASQLIKFIFSTTSVTRCDLTAFRDEIRWIKPQHGFCIYNIGATHRFLNLSTTGKEHFFQALSKNTKRTLKRAQKKAKSIGEVTSETYEGYSDRNLSRFMAIEESNWKGRQGTAISTDKSLTRFYQTLLTNISPLVRWRFLKFGTIDVAGQMMFFMGGTLYVWKIGYVDKYANASPGNLLFEEFLYEAFESPEVTELDVITDQVWHDRWKLSRNNLHHHIIFKRSLTGFLRYGFERVLGAAKKVKKLVRTAAQTNVLSSRPNT